MNLFQTGNFTLRSGLQSNWKIECDSFTVEDWETLAVMAVERLPQFGSVQGVPRGGVPFAKALEKYATVGPVLIAEDVVTTGGSILKFMKCSGLSEKDCIGVCVFQRGEGLGWVTPIMIVTPAKGTE